MKKLTAVVIGYGNRGVCYTRYALDHPEELEIVAVAEALQARRDTAKKRFNLSDENIYTSWEDLAAQPKMADFAIISTQDNMHYAPALAMIEKGYNLLLEKPMAPPPQECKAITEAAEKKGVTVVVCHVLRFTKFWKAIKDILDSGELGDPVSITHIESVGNVHQSHSFVRGNWRNAEESTCMIIAKSCHDMDILQWLIGKKCTQVQSFGSLTHFTRANQPEGAPDYCVKGCPVADTCPYNAVKLYYDDKDNSWFRPVAANTVEMPSDEAVWDAISTGPYGRCVYQCDNNVVDHQVVNMEFEGGCTVSFSMNCFNEGGRSIRIFGTKGELIGDMHTNTLRLYSFATQQWTQTDLDQIDESILGGHGGGDTGIVIDLLHLLRGEAPSKSVCDVRTSYENHLIGFAAEQSRLDRSVVDLKLYSDTI
jgi:predicted dehydrogenase